MTPNGPMRGLQRSDTVILTLYAVLPVCYFGGAAFGVASGVPGAMSVIGIALFYMATIFGITLPIWTIVHVLRNRHSPLFVIWIESILAGALAGACAYAGLFGKADGRFTGLIAAAVGGCIALTPLLRLKTGDSGRARTP